MLYTATMEELRIFIRASRNFVENPNKQFPFHAATLYTSPKMFVGDRSAVLVDRHTNLALELVKNLNTLMSHTRTTINPQLQIFFSCMRLYSSDPRTKQSLGGSL